MYELDYCLLLLLLCEKKLRKAPPWNWWNCLLDVYSAAQIYPNYAYAYYTLVFCVYAYVYTRIRVCEYARICPFVMHSYKFLYMKHCWSNKGHMGMTRLQSEICILFKRHADEWKLSHFKFSITSQIHWPFLWLLLDLKLPKLIWEENWNSRLKSLS